MTFPPILRNELLGANLYVHFIYLFFLIHSQKLMISLYYWLHSLQSEFLKCPGIGVNILSGRKQINS